MPPMKLTPVLDGVNRNCELRRSEVVDNIRPSATTAEDTHVDRFTRDRNPGQLVIEDFALSEQSHLNTTSCRIRPPHSKVAGPLRLAAPVWRSRCRTGVRACTPIPRRTGTSHSNRHLHTHRSC